MEDLPLLTDYICENINADYSPDRGYYWHQYNKITLVTCLLFACGNKNAVYRQSLVRERQFVTTNLINSYKDKEHKNCRCSTV